MNEQEHKIMANVFLIRVARAVSLLFTPFSIPFLSFLVLFLFTYLHMLPTSYKVYVLAMVYCFTILLPTVAIFLYRRFNGWKRTELAERKKRYFPIFFTIFSYICCWLLMKRLNLPPYMVGIVFSALLIAIICFVTNLKWKLSEHMAGAGGVVGGLVAFGALFGYNPVGWLCVFIFVSGVLGSARIVLGHHTLGEVLWGFAVGLTCTLLVLHPASRFLYLILFLL